MSLSKPLSSSLNVYLLFHNHTSISEYVIKQHSKSAIRGGFRWIRIRFPIRKLKNSIEKHN